MAGTTKGGFVLGAAVGAAAGALVAWALVGGAPRGGGPAVAAKPPIAATPAPHPASAAQPAVAVQPAAQPDRHAALRACQQALAVAEARAGEANGQLHQASGKLAEAKAIQAEDEGTPPKPPPDMPARFKDPKYARKAVKALFDGVGGGQITSVDCTEFPCLVYGDVSRDTSRAREKTIRALARAAMDTDGWGLCGLGEWISGREKRPTAHYAYGICPKGYFQGMTSSEKQRVSWRIHEMLKANLGQ